MTKVDNKTPALLVDDRAGSKELIKFNPIDTCGQLCRLDSGDVAFAGNGPNGLITVGVEVKSITDLISSIAVGRLQATQIPRMFEQYDDVWLLYYGEYRPALASGSLQTYRPSKAKTNWMSQMVGTREVPYGWLENMLTTLAMGGVHVKWVGGHREEGVRRAAYWIGMLARWYSKPWTEHKGFRAFDKSQQAGLTMVTDSLLMLRAKVASALPGIGFERAMSVAKYFPTVEAMMSATVEEWSKVPGVGKTLARAAHQVIRTGNTSDVAG